MAKRSGEKRLPAWEVSDAFWQRVKPLIPARQREAGKDYARRSAARRKTKKLVIPAKAGIQFGYNSA